LRASSYRRWKELERRTARKMGGRRLWRARDYSESVPDGETGEDVWDCKDRVSMTALTWYRQAEAKYRPYVKGRRFLLVLCDTKGRGEYVLLKLDDYVQLLREYENAVDEANH
jgi:hypothetical protein